MWKGDAIRRRISKKSTRSGSTLHTTLP
jgi:hypothetical protein